jgi:hypothetical protein
LEKLAGLAWHPSMEWQQLIQHIRDAAVRWEDPILCLQALLGERTDLQRGECPPEPVPRSRRWEQEQGSVERWAHKIPEQRTEQRKHTSTDWRMRTSHTARTSRTAQRGGQWSRGTWRFGFGGSNASKVVVKSHILKRIKTRIECETARGPDGKRHFPSTSAMAAGGCEQAGCAGRIGLGTRLSCEDRLNCSQRPSGSRSVFCSESGG